MSYTAMYRRFRPTTFEEVKGQDAIVTTLKNQIRSDRIGHAYLFCGTRGTGKTSIAKLFAKSVNCEHPVMPPGWSKGAAGHNAAVNAKRRKVCFLQYLAPFLSRFER